MRTYHDDTISRPGSRPRSRPIISAARILCDGAAAHCVITAFTKDGVEVSSATLTAFPEQVQVELAGRASWAATCVWQNGMEAGFRFTEPV